MDFEVEGDQGEITLDFTAFDATTLPEEGAICYNTEDCSIHVALGLLADIVNNEAEAGYDIDVNAALVDNYEFDFDKAEMGKADSGIRFEGGELVIEADGFVELTEGERLLRVRATGLTALKQALLEAENVSIEVVSGNVPLGSEASYTAHTDEETAELVENYINNEENGDSEVAGYSAADLKIVRNDETLPVEGQFKVTVDKESLVPAGMKLDKLYHIHDGAVEALDVNETEAGYEFTMTGFSDIVASYTVDFSYVDGEGVEHTWKFPGTGSHKISEVLEALGIEAEEITAVDLERTKIVGEFGEKDLYLSQDAESGEWYINSDAPFDDTYLLTVTADEKVYEITVTDAITLNYPITVKIDPNITTPQHIYAAVKVNLQYYRTDHGWTEDRPVDGYYYFEITGNSSSVSGTATKLYGADGIELSLNSKYYTTINSIDVFVAYNKNNGTGEITSYNDLLYNTAIKGNGDTISDQSYPIIITKDNNSATISIGNVGPVEHTARINFYDEWLDTVNETANLVSGYTLEATVGEDIYVASITGSGDLSFTKDGGTTNNSILPDAVSAWTFKHNGTAQSAPIALGDYVISNANPSASNHIYTFEARKPNTYTASLTFKNASGSAETPSSLDGDYYLVVNDAAYAPVTVSGIDGGVALPEITSFKFVKATGAVSSVSDLTGLPAVTKIGDYDILTTAIPTPDSSHNYAFEAKLPTVCTVKITLSDAVAAGHYYVVARKNNANVGYAEFSAQGETTLSFTDGTNAVTLDDNTTFWIVKSQSALANLSGIDSLTDKLTTSGGDLGDYAFTWASQPDGNSVYAITATKVTVHSVTVQFKDAESQNVANPGLDDYFYLVAKVNGERKYFAPVTVNGKLTFVDAAGTDHTDDLPNVTFELVKADSEVTALANLPAETTPAFTSGDMSYTLGTAALAGNVYAFTPTEATAPTDYTVEIRMLNAEGEPEQPSQNLNGNNYKLVTVMVLDSDKVATTESNNMNPGQYTDGQRSYTYQQIGGVNYVPGAIVETYLGPDISWDSTTKTVNNGATNAIVDGSVIGDYVFEKTVEPGKTTYIGRPLEQHTVNVTFDEAPATSYQLYAEEVRNGKTYYSSNELNFNNGVNATTTVKSLTAANNGGTIAVSGNTQYYIVKNYGTKYGNGSVEDGKVYTVTTDGDITTITRGPAVPYSYTVKVVQNDGSTGTGSKPNLNENEEEWYVQATVIRPDGPYSYVTKIHPDNFTNDTFTGSISVFYREADAGNVSNAAQTAYLAGEHVSFALLRPAGNLGSTAPWAYFANTANINYNGLNGAAIEGLYTLNIAEGTDTTTLKLVEGPQASLVFAAHEGATKATAVEAPADLNNPGAGKYFVYARLYVPDGVKHRTGFYVAELPTGAEQKTYAISDGFRVNRAQSGENVNNVKYLVVGDRIFETGLVYTNDAAIDSVSEMLAALNRYEPSTQIRTDNPTSQTPAAKPYTLIVSGETAGGYRLVSSDGDRTNPVGTLDLVKLPRLSVAGVVRQENDATATTFKDPDNKYYALVELVQDGVKSYALKPLNTANNANGITTAADQVNEYVDTITGRKYFYESGDTVNYYVIKSTTEVTSVTDAVDLPRFAEGQLMGKYVPSFEKEGGVTTVVLTEQQPTEGQAHTVNVQLYDYDKTTQLGTEAHPVTQLPYEKFSVLSYLTPKGTGAKGQVVAWNVQQIYATSSDDSDFADPKPAMLNTAGHTSLTIPKSGFSICDANMNAIEGAFMGYDPELYDLNVRMFHGSVVMASYNDRYAETDAYTHTPKFSDDAPTGYDYMDPVQTDEATTIRLHNAYTKDYKLKLQINQIDEVGIDFQENENYWLMVQLNHKSGAPTYAFAQLKDISSNAVGQTEFDLELYHAGDKYWFTGNSTPEKTMAQGFTGNEAGVTFSIVKAESPISFGNIQSHGGKDIYIHTGESVDLYTLSYGGRSTEETIAGASSKTTITDTVVLTEDVNGIKKGEIDSIIAQAREFGLYTEILSKHATDMEANIGADRVTGPIGADYGFSSRNTMVNRLKVVKRYLDASGVPVNNKQVTLGLFDAETGEQVGASIQKTTGADNMPNGVAEFEFTELKAGKYVIKEYINNQWYGFEDVSSPISYDGGDLTVNFADGVITMLDINTNVNYFGSIASGVNLTDLLRHSREGIVVTDDNYSDLKAADPSGKLATVYQTGSEEYPKTYDIPADMQRLRSLSARLADSNSSKTVRVMNYKLSEIPTNGISITGDGRYVVLNIDLTGVGSRADVFTRVHYDGHQLDPDFGRDGKEDSSKVLWNFYTRDSQGVAHPYTGHIDTSCEGAGVLLAPDAVVGDLGGNWGGTIICREAQHSGSEIHSDNPNKIINTNTMLTNSLSSEKLGNLKLQKVITGETRDRTTWFTFNVTLKDAEGNLINGTFLASGLQDGNEVTFVDGVATPPIKVRAENQVTIAGLPDGATYHVDELETEESEFYQLVQIENGDGFVTSDGTIQGGKTVVAKAINAHKVGGLTINKTVAGIKTTQEFNFRVTIMEEGSEDYEHPDTTFTGIHGGMSFTEGVATFKLGNGESRTIEASEIPTGRKFKVEEIDHDQKVKGVQFITDVTVKTTGGIACQVDDEDAVTGTITDDKNAIIVAYTNTHTNGTTYQPKVTKHLKMDEAAVADAKWPAEGFSFTLAWADGVTETDKAGAKLTSTTATATAAKKTATFGAIQFDYDTEPWERTYHFTITEKQGSAPGVTYNTEPLDLWVHVSQDTTTDPTNPVLVVDDVQYGGSAYDASRSGKPADQEAVKAASGEITNQYDEVRQSPKGSKVLTGREWGNNETFSFTLTPDVFTLSRIGTAVELPVVGSHVDEPAHCEVVAVNDETKAITLTVHKPVNATLPNIIFPELAFKAPGTYGFIMEEVGKGEKHDGLIYSGKSLKVTFTVTESAGRLHADDPVYTVLSGATGEETAANKADYFVNTSEGLNYTPKVTKSLIVNGAEAANEQWPDDEDFEGFRFHIASDPTNPVGATLPTDKSALATVDNKTAVFGAIRFHIGAGVDYPATYQFNITEQVPAETHGITYATDPLPLTIVVNKNGNTLSIRSVQYGDEAEVKDATGIVDASGTITNTIPDEGKGALTITKQVTVNGQPVTNPNNATPADGEYTFAVTGPNEYTNTVSITIANGQASSAQLTDLAPGEYTITENAAANGARLTARADGATPADTSFKTDGKRGIKVTVAAGDTADAHVAVFTNDKLVIDVTGQKTWKNDGAPIYPANVSVTIQMAQFSRHSNSAGWAATGQTESVTITISEDGASWTRKVGDAEEVTTRFTNAPGSADYAAEYNAAMAYTWQNLSKTNGLDAEDEGYLEYGYRVTETNCSTGYYSDRSVDVKTLTATGAQDIINLKVSEVALPATGGVGTGIVYGAGAALMLLAVLGLILLNRKRTDGEGIR